MNRRLVFPMVMLDDRDGTLGALARWAFFIPRLAGWIVGIALGSVLAGLVQGWEDVR